MIRSTFWGLAASLVLAIRSMRESRAPVLPISGEWSLRYGWAGFRWGPAMNTTESDRELFAPQLDTLVPVRVFDAHAHLHRAALFSGKLPDLVAVFPEMGLPEPSEILEDITPTLHPMAGSGAKAIREG